MIATGRRPLNERQREIFDFICLTISQESMSPTVREIGDRFDIKSPNGVRCHLVAIAKKGWLTPPDRGKSRGWLPVAESGHCRCCGQPLPTTE